MMHNRHMKRILYLLIGFMLIIPVFASGLISGGNVLAEEEKIFGHTWEETMNEFLPNEKDNGLRYGDDDYHYKGCHTCTGVTMLVTSYYHGIGFITGDHGGSRSVWKRIGSYNTKERGNKKEDILNWLCNEVQAEKGDVLTNGFGDVGSGAHTAVITNADMDDYREIDETKILFEGQKLINDAANSSKKTVLYLYRYQGYSGEFEDYTIKEEVPRFFYEINKFSVHKENTYKKSACGGEKDYMHIPAGSKVTVLTGVNNNSNYCYVYYQPKDKNGLGLYGQGVYAYVAKKYIDLGIKIDKKNFPDANFRKYIQEAGFDRGEDGYLGVKDIEQATEIDCKMRNIKNLTGIEYFTSLKTLDCSSNKLKNLNVGKNTALTSLVCDGNELTGLDISNNPKLELLSCSNTKLTELDISNNAKLKQLDCSYNQLTKLDISKNKQLQILNCSNNQMTKLDARRNKKLTDLNCFFNQLNSIDLRGTTELLKLNCTENQLTDLNILNNTKLQLLQCSSNPLKKLDLSRNTDLQYLECVGNELTALDVSINTKLEVLSCSHNQLTALDVRKNTKLKELDCCVNQLTKLDVRKNTKLECLWCFSNRLTLLNVSKNVNLQEVDCHSNQLLLLTLGKNSNLKQVRCNENNLVFLNICQCPKLVKIVEGVKPKTVKIAGTPFYGWGKSHSTNFPDVYLFIDKGVNVITPSTVEINSIEMNKTSAALPITLSKKGTVQLTATIAPAKTTYQTLTWKSSNTAVAKVSSSGKVTAVGYGTCEITATAQDGTGKKAVCTITVTQDEIRDNDLIYSLNQENLTAKVTGPVKATISKVVIPATVKANGKTYKVTDIGKAAFRDLNVTSLEIGKNVTKIGAAAFSGCTELADITILSSKISKVGTGAFKGLTLQVTVRFGAGLKATYITKLVQLLLKGGLQDIIQVFN